MTQDNVRDREDEWQDRLLAATYRLSSELRELHDSNPWPERPVIEQALNTLATELWDRCFSQAEIVDALEAAAADLPRYTGGQHIRP